MVEEIKPLTIEQLAKYTEIYKLYHLLLEKKVDCDLYYTDKGFSIEAKYFEAVAGDDENSTNGRDEILLKLRSKTIKGLTADKAIERIGGYDNGDKTERHIVNKT